MSFKLSKAILTGLLALTGCMTAAQASPFIMGYYGNWHVWSSMGKTRSDYYQITGSKNRDTGAIVNNIVLNKQLQNLTAVSYAFLNVYPDAGMYKDVQQKPVDPKQIGTVFWSDPWTDLSNNDSTAKFCSTHPISCYYAYQVEHDANTSRPAVDTSQPWNYFYMGNFDAFTKLPRVKHIISIGGWYHEGSFEKAAFVNPGNFIHSIIDIIKHAKESGGSIDGIDLDYEPPAGYTAEMATQLVSLTKQLRQTLDAQGFQDVILTAAVFADPDKVTTFDGGRGNWKAFAASLNYIGIMGYDYHGTWDSPAMTGLHSNMYADQSDPNPNDFSSQKAVEAFLAVGVPREKLVLGIPSYGRLVGGVTSAANHGLYQSFDPSVSVQEDMDKGQVSYYKIVGQWLGKGYPDHTMYYNGQVSGVWAYNTSNHQFVSYDNTSVIDTKTDYVLNNGLGGMMMWELIGDISPDDANNASLLCHMAKGLLGKCTQ